MTLPTPAPRDDQCLATEANCRCILAVHSDMLVHECECGGQFFKCDDGTGFRAVVLPGGVPISGDFIGDMTKVLLNRLERGPYA